MKTIVFWIMLAIILVLGIRLSMSQIKLRNASELARVDELELEQSQPDSINMRAIIVGTPREQLRSEILKRVRALRDSADVLRDDIVTMFDTVTLAQEHEIDHLRRHATELETLAMHTSGEELTDRQRLNLYRTVVRTYGAGGFVARQMRREVGIPPRG